MCPDATTLVPAIYQHLVSDYGFLIRVVEADTRVRGNNSIPTDTDTKYRDAQGETDRDTGQKKSKRDTERHRETQRAKGTRSCARCAHAHV